MVLRLILLRHAEAEDADTADGDHARRLTARGEAQALATARQLVLGGYVPTLALVSDAQRTRATWAKARPAFAATIPVWERHPIYTGGVTAILEQVSEVAAAQHQCIVLVGHNPHISELVQELAGVHQRLGKADAVILETTKAGAPDWATAVWQKGSWSVKTVLHAKV